MEFTRKRLAALVGAVAVSAIASGAAQPAASAAAPKPRAAVAKTQDAGQATKYWTAKRMRTARPADVAQPPRGDGSARAQRPKPTVRAGALPQRPAGRVRAAGWPAGSPSDYAKYWNKRGGYPERVVGKLFYTGDGGDYTCTASVAVSANKSTLFTAGHCVTEPGSRKWNRNFAFVPDYDRGDRPVGTWGVRNVTVTPEWFYDTRWDHDFAALVVNRDGAGRPIQDRTGAFGWSFGGRGTGDDWKYIRSFGYPGYINGFGSIDGERMLWCENWSRVTFRDEWKRAQNCNMSNGSSGGPWVEGDGTVVGVVSHGYGQEKVQYASILGDSEYRAFDSAQRS